MKSQTRFIRLMLKLQLNVRMFHWNTHIYGNHIASDRLYEDLDKHIDRFVEVFISKHGRVPPGTRITLNTDVISDKYIVPYLKSASTFLSSPKLYNSFSNDPDLQTILSDIIEALNRAVYLMEIENKER